MIFSRSVASAVATVGPRTRCVWPPQWLPLPASSAWMLPAETAMAFLRRHASSPCSGAGQEKTRGDLPAGGSVGRWVEEICWCSLFEVGIQHAALLRAQYAACRRW